MSVEINTSSSIKKVPLNYGIFDYSMQENCTEMLYARIKKETVAEELPKNTNKRSSSSLRYEP